MSPKGILRNAPESYDFTDEDAAIDRHTVLDNTLANARLHDENAAKIQTEQIKKQVRENPELALQWDEANLEYTDKERKELGLGTMKITEPKTPFQGAVGDSEYYKDDDIDDIKDDGFSLGEPEVDVSKDSSTENDRIIVDEKAAKDAQEAAQESEAESKHRRFEEMRKAHYHMKADVLKHPMPQDDDDDDEEA